MEVRLGGTIPVLVPALLAVSDLLFLLHLAIQFSAQSVVSSLPVLLVVVAFSAAVQPLAEELAAKADLVFLSLPLCKNKCDLTAETMLLVAERTHLRLVDRTASVPWMT